MINYLNQEKKQEQNYWGPRFWLDNAYAIVIYFFILQIVGAIIVDNFTFIRQQEQELKEDKENSCFVCGLKNQEINRLYDNEYGFKSHIKLDHYYWNYLFLLINIQDENDLDLSGDDKFIRQCYQKQSLNWVPERYV